MDLEILMYTIVLPIGSIVILGYRNWVKVGQEYERKRNNSTDVT